MKLLAALSTFALYNAALWLAAQLPTWFAEWIVMGLAFAPGLVLILWRFRLLDAGTRRPDLAIERSFTRLGWSGTFWLVVAMTVNAAAVSELAASEALPARIALAALVLTTGLGLAAVAWIREGARPRRAG